MYDTRKSTLPKITSPDMMEACKVIYKCLDDTSPVVMYDYINYEYEDSIRKVLVEKNDAKENNDAIEISIETENKDVLHGDITDN